MKQFILFVFISFFSYTFVFSQGEIDDEDKIFFRNEKTWGVGIYTNGYGGSYRFAKRINARRKSIYEIGFSHIKHPKEIKISTDYYNINQYVHGKLNMAYEFNGVIGFQKEVYRKKDKGSVSIRYFYGIGPSLVLLKPIYYEIIDTEGTKHEKFNLNTYQAILGKSSFVLGIDEIAVNPGAYLKAGLTFEFSKRYRKFTALEVGGTVRGYLKEVEIMATQNTQIIYSLFLSYRFGKIVRGGRFKKLDEKELEEGKIN